MFGIFSKWITNDHNITNSPGYVSDRAKIGKNVKFGYGSCIGYGDPSMGPIVIGNNVTIGAFCIISFGAFIGENTNIDDYSKVGGGVSIGRNCRLLYGKHIYDDAQIGDNCIIGGHVADRTIIEHNVTYMGEIAHSHRDPNEDWDETEEPSPIIKAGTVVGLNAIIIGGLSIGPCAYIGAGEIVRVDVPENFCYIKNQLSSIKSYRGIIKARSK